MLRRLVASLLLALGVAEGARAQAGIGDAAGEFLQPVGARSVALGQAVVASARGSEAIWWNPALVARSSREFSINSVSGMPPAETDLSITALYSLPHVMTVGLTARYFNYGPLPASELTDTSQTGSFVAPAYVIAATFAAPFGNRLAVGTTVKLLTLPFDCTGTCPNRPQSSPVTGAVDIGVQYIGTKDSLFTIGAAVRTVGLPLQFNDAPQADELPGRIDIGVEIAPKFANYPGLSVRGSASVVTRVFENSGPGFRAGVEASWLNQVFGRAGYVKDGPTGSGPSIGGGIARGRWHLDFAQFLSETSSAVGLKPTYVSLRYSF